MLVIPIRASRQLPHYFGGQAGVKDPQLQPFAPDRSPACCVGMGLFLLLCSTQCAHHANCLAVLHGNTCGLWLMPCAADALPQLPGGSV